MFLIIVLIGLADSTLESNNNNSCVSDPKSCLPHDQVTRINQLIPYLFVDDDNLPYFCILFHPLTVPSGIQCMDCSDSLVSCQPDQAMTENWDEVCTFFCPRATTTTTLIQSRNPRRDLGDNGSTSIPIEIRGIHVDKASADGNQTNENTTALMNGKMSNIASVSVDNHHPFPVAVWLQLAFIIVLSLGGMGVALYLGCCFRGCSRKLRVDNRYSRQDPNDYLLVRTNANIN